MSFLKNFWQEEAGQDMVEYALLLGFIALAGTVAYSTISSDIKTIWSYGAIQTTAAKTAAS